MDDPAYDLGRRWLGARRPFFHGTSREFKPGDTIEPQSRSYAHATPEVRTARVFGPNVYEVQPTGYHGPADETWTRRMKYTGNEVHYETLGPQFVVVNKIPKSRRDSYYDKKYPLS